jgi:5-deoxy-glucuronate isomerase
MDWHRHYDPQPGYTRMIGPSPDGLKYLTFGMLRLRPGEQFAASSGQSEIGMVILSGVCHATAGESRFKDIGSRNGYFDGKPWALYLPPGTSYAVTGVTDVEIAVGHVPAASGGPVTLVNPDMVTTKVFGGGPTHRTVNFVIYDAVPASRLIVGETYHTSGGWSGYPPHKHDQDNMPTESANEEVYLIKIEPPQGFGFLRVYDRAQLDESYLVKDNDVVAVPRGYHPMVGAPGYKVGFMWFMAGEKRPWKPVTDPDHAWAG